MDNAARLLLLLSIAAQAVANERLVAAKKQYGDTLIGILQIVPPLLSQVVVLSPLTTVNRIKESRTVGGLPLLPYAMMVTNGFLWVVYGVVVGDNSIVGANLSALVLGAHYCYVYVEVATSEDSTTQPLLIASLCAALVALFYWFLPNAQAADAIGSLGCAVVVVMFSGPLQALKSVIDEKSTRKLPFPMAVATCMNCSMWTLYGLAVQDAYIYGPNILGLLSGIAQLTLFAVFGFSKDKV